eukprot:s4427_g1.t1
MADQTRTRSRAKTPEGLHSERSDQVPGAKSKSPSRSRGPKKAKPEKSPSASASLPSPAAAAQSTRAPSPAKPPVARGQGASSLTPPGTRPATGSRVRAPSVESNASYVSAVSQRPDVPVQARRCRGFCGG